VSVQQFKRFIATVKLSKNTKVLIVLDGHSTHAKNLEAIKLARENDGLLLSVAAHTTQKLQQLDVSFFKLLTTL